MNNTESCSHCSEQIIIPFNSNDYPNEIFCCKGCQTVYEILKENQLGDYYKIQSESSDIKQSAVKLSNNKYLYLDEEEFRAKHVHSLNETMKMSFYLEGVHCLACLWLLEKLPQINNNVLLSELNMSKSTIEITISKSSHFSEVAKLLEKLGYPPHPIMEGKEVTEFRKKEDQKDLIRIIISFFCAGNIMLMAFSIYAGAAGIIQKYFDYFSLALFLPILFYCAIPFYKNAIGSLKGRTVSIDFPIVLAIILGTLLSVYSVFTEYKHIYFDSLSILVFLLLTTRFLLKKSQHKGLAAAEISDFFSNITTTRINDDQREEIHAKFLNIGDIFLVKPGETIACDGTVMEGHSSLNTALMTGEILPITIKEGEEVISGCVNISHDIKVRANKTTQDSNLGRILQSVEKGWSSKSEISNLANQIAKYFVGIVLLITSATFYYFYSQGELETAILRSLAIIVITCPCALGLATPLTLTLSLSKLAKLGIIAKNASVFENITRAKHILFDKTGTLTHGNFKVNSWSALNDINYDQLIYALEIKSSHPVAVSIVAHLKHKWKNENIQYTPLHIQNLSEIPGQGMYGELEGKKYSLISSVDNETEHTFVSLLEDTIEVVRVELSDEIKSTAIDVINELKEKQFDPFIVSGDAKGPVLEVGKVLKFPRKNLFYKHDPEAKKRLVIALGDAILIGDGANDAIALSNASVGIAVHGSVDISLRAADVFMANSDLKNITKLVTISEETLNIIYRNINFSFVYNVIGVYLAINGMISPLIAAVLMPVSSLTVVLSSIIGTKKTRSIFK